jgi:enterochelin esterase-like enzyme
MKHLFRVFFFFVIVSHCYSQSFNEFITQINIAPMDERQALADSLIADLPNNAAPILEDGRAWFIYSGNASSISIAGDMTNWSPEINLMNVGSTNFWYSGFNCDNSARLDYKIVINGSQWILDPLNPRTCSGGYGPNSELSMPEYIQPEEILDHGFPDCGVDVYPSFYSPQLDNNRTIKIVTPPGYNPDLHYRVMLVHDGTEYISLGYLENVMAWLYHEYPEIELPICVCVPPVNRTAEYQNAQQVPFGEFIVDTVIPFVNDNYATWPDDPEKWGTMGASNGGNISLFLAGTYPDKFRQLAIMSPYAPDEQRDAILNQPIDTYHIYLNWGSYDIPYLIPLIEQFNQEVEGAGIDYFYRMYHEGHSWGLWRATIDEAFQFLYLTETSLDQGDSQNNMNGSLPNNIDLAIWPNPFNGGTRISVNGGQVSKELSIYNLLGNRVYKRVLGAASSSFYWGPGNIASGKYIVEVRAGQMLSLESVIYHK